jgi:hypothetical protein
MVASEDDLVYKIQPRLVRSAQDSKNKNAHNDSERSLSILPSHTDRELALPTQNGPKVLCTWPEFDNTMMADKRDRLVSWSHGLGSCSYAGPLVFF